MIDSVLDWIVVAKLGGESCPLWRHKEPLSRAVSYCLLFFKSWCQHKKENKCFHSCGVHWQARGKNFHSKVNPTKLGIFKVVMNSKTVCGKKCTESCLPPCPNAELLQLCLFCCLAGKHQRGHQIVFVLSDSIWDACITECCITGLKKIPKK